MLSVIICITKCTHGAMNQNKFLKLLTRSTYLYTLIGLLLIVHVYSRQDKFKNMSNI